MHASMFGIGHFPKLEARDVLPIEYNGAGAMAVMDRQSVCV